MTAKTVRAAVLHEVGVEPPYAQRKPLVVEEVTLDEPGAGEVLVRIETAGVCHSDLSVVDGARPRPVPMALGHEAAGVVEAVGSDTRLRAGQRVVMTFLPRCGQCEACATDGRQPCIPGSASNAAGTLLSGARRLSLAGQPIHHHLGVSAFATHAVVDERSAVVIDDDVPSAVACLFGCAVLTGAGAVFNAGGLEHAERVAVVGLGGVGMAALLAALSVDGVTVIGVDNMPSKCNLARDWGAAACFAPEEALDGNVRADLVIEAAGAASAFEAALALTAPGGRTVSVGLPHPDARVTMSPLTLVAEARTIIGSYLGSAVPSRDIPRFAELWRAGRLPVERLVSSTIALDEINTAMDRLASGTVLRQVITFE